MSHPQSTGIPRGAKSWENEVGSIALQTLLNRSAWFVTGLKHTPSAGLDTPTPLTRSRRRVGGPTQSKQLGKITPERRQNYIGVILPARSDGCNDHLADQSASFRTH